MWSPSVLFSHHDTHPLLLCEATDRAFREHPWSTFEPETLRSTLPRIVKQSVSAIAWERLFAWQVIREAPERVLSSWEVFLPIVQAMGNILPDFTTVHPPSLARLWFACDVLAPFLDLNALGDEVFRAMLAALWAENIYTAPSPLSFLQPMLSRPYYVCDSCGREEDVIDDFDGLCNGCGKEWSRTLNGEQVEDPTLLAQGGTTRVGTRHDPKPVHVRILQFATSDGDLDLNEDDEVDVQACRLLSALDYVSRMQERYKEQKALFDPSSAPLVSSPSSPPLSNTDNMRIAVPHLGDLP